jgi:hypothetical protein
MAYPVLYDVGNLFHGGAIFGVAVNCQIVKNPSAAQVDAFFGVSGQQSLHGGGRGRAIVVSFLLTSVSFDLATQVNLIESYDDGIGRVFQDDMGRLFPIVVFRRLEPEGRLMPGPCRKYKAFFESLT